MTELNLNKNNVQTRTNSRLVSRFIRPRPLAPASFIMSIKPAAFISGTTFFNQFLFENNFSTSSSTSPSIAAFKTTSRSPFVYLVYAEMVSNNEIIFIGISWNNIFRYLN